MKQGKELYKKYRPKNLSNVIGQQAAVSKLEGYIERNSLPHVLLITGPSGCGKTTIGRILKKVLKCGNADFTETNGASFNGVKDARAIEQRMNGAPIDGECRIWLIDECHRITDAAWDVLLKPLEDTPDHVYFFLCTSEPQKVKRTVKTRCSEIAVSNISKKDLGNFVCNICKKEKTKLSKAITNNLLEIADGSARQALVLLDGIIMIKDEDEQMSILESADVRARSETIVKMLLNPKKNTRNELRRLLLDMKGKKEDVEGIRRMILGYVTTVGLRNPKITPRCLLIYESFCENFYNTGFAGLVFGCYEVLNSEE